MLRPAKRAWLGAFRVCACERTSSKAYHAGLFVPAVRAGLSVWNNESLGCGLQPWGRRALRGGDGHARGVKREKLGRDGGLRRGG